MEFYIVLYWKDDKDPDAALFNNEDAAFLCSIYFRRLGYKSTFVKRGVASNFSFNTRKDNKDEP